MKFTCTKKWEKMAAVDNGRFCDSCQKPVIDFTSWDRDELIDYFRSGTRTCGMFTREQVDPDLIPLSHVGKGVRRGFFASIAALALTSAQAQQAPAHPGTEQVYQAEPDDALNGNCERVPGTTAHRVEGSKDHAIVPPVVRRSKNHLFLSRRFPFFHVAPRKVRNVRVGFF